MDNNCPLNGFSCEKEKVYQIKALNKISYICEDCNLKKIIENYEGLNIINLLFSIIELSKPKKTNDIMKIECKYCNSTLEEISRAGKLGCQECYFSFKEVIIKLIDKCQEGNKIHIGKKPKNLSNEILEKELQKAIAEENYEEALRIKNVLKFR